MDTEVLVHIDLNNQPTLVGRLWARARKGRESASFEYEGDWLNHPGRFALEPALMLTGGAIHTQADKQMFGAIGDSAPDRWGRVLMRRAERRRASNEDRDPKTLREIDYLLGVNDEARQGALRFSLEPDGPFLATGDTHPIPPLIELPRLLTAANHFTREDDSDEDLRLLLAPGSSLGGARPKASIRDKDGHLAIAKFPHPNDDYDTVRWEAVALTLAKKAGINTPIHRIELVAGQHVLIARRFDRVEENRLPFLSAMSMLEANDNETHSYMEIVDALRQYGASPKEDMVELWRRIVFSILINNTDDHLRNHGFLCLDPRGWTLSPLYDVNPVPIDVSPRVLTTCIDVDDPTASVELAVGVSEYFELDRDKARSIAREVAVAVSDWRNTAKRFGCSKSELDRMASAFEHNDLAQAKSG